VVADDLGDGTFVTADDLQHAERLIRSRSQVGDRVSELADTSTELASL